MAHGPPGRTRGRRALGTGLGREFRRFCPRRRAEEGRGRHAHAGRHISGRGALRFAPSGRQRYIEIRKGETVCVDDPSSPAYNTITSRAKVGRNTHVEDMGGVELYRRGLIVDYPTVAAGSCIFIHVWRSNRKGTAGCVALPEERVSAIQDFSEPGAVVAIVPEAAAPRFAGCLPDIGLTGVQ